MSPTWHTHCQHPRQYYQELCNYGEAWKEKYSNKYFIFIKIAFLSGKNQAAIVIHRQEYQLFKSKRK